MKDYKKWLKWIGNIGFGLVMLFMVVMVFFSVSSKLSKSGIPQLGSYQLMVVLSGSMSPVFEAGDVIVVSAEKKQTEYKKGEIITFKDPQDDKRIITHRVVEVVKEDKKLSYKTKGDANKTEDIKPVPSVNVLGQEKFHIPFFGNVVEFAKTKQGFAWLILLPGILIIVSEIRNIGKAITEEIESKKKELEIQSISKE